MLDSSWPLIVSHKCGGTHLKCIELSRGAGFPDFNIFHRPSETRVRADYRVIVVLSVSVNRIGFEAPSKNASNPAPNPGHNAFSFAAHPCEREERKPSTQPNRAASALFTPNFAIRHGFQPFQLSRAICNRSSPPLIIFE